MKKIENKELVKRILYCLNKKDSEELTEEELADIENISFEYRLINGNQTGISIEDVLLFPNLKSLTLKGYALSMKDLQVISERIGIKTLSFIGCNFDDIDFEQIEILPENLKFISCKRLPKKFPKVRKVDINLSLVDFDSISLEETSDIIIRNSKVINIHDLREYENICTVNLDGSKLIGTDGEKVEDIEVAENTLYSHEEEKRHEATDKLHESEDDLGR